MAFYFYDSPGLSYDSGVLWDSGPPSIQERKRMSKIKLGLRERTREQKLSQANTIKTSLTGNPNFTTPNPTLAAYGALITAAQTKLNAYNLAKAALATALADCDATFEALDVGTTQLASYAENVANGDKVKLESGGFEVRSDVTPVGPLTQVLNLVLTAGDNEGTLDAGWDPLRGAGSYEVQTSADRCRARVGRSRRCRINRR
jgi:hypothetical protein